MRKSRILAVLMAVFMVISMLPSVAFAAAEVPGGTLDGKLKVKGSVAVGITLGADYTKVKPEGITDDDVTFSWSRKDGETLTEVGTEKEYKVAQEDLGYPLVLKITGQAEKGFSGELSVTTAAVAATEEEAKALAAEQEAKEAAEAGTDAAAKADNGNEQDASEDQNAEQESSGEENSESDQNVEENAETTGTQETTEEVPGNDNDQDVEENAEADQEESQDADTESGESDGVVEIGGDQEEPGNDQNVEENTEADQNAEGNADADTDQNADTTPGTDENNDKDPDVIEIGGNTVGDDALSVITDNGEGSLDFGTIQEGYTETDLPEFQYVTFKNESSETLNFKTVVPPENFLVQDITEPLPAGETVTVGVQPRTGLPAGDYSNTVITYETEEGASASFTVNFVVSKADAEPEPDPDPEPNPNPVAETEYGISVDNMELSFADLQEGYSEVTETQTFTVYNDSTGSVTLLPPESESFVVSPLSGDDGSDTLQIPEKGEMTFSVEPQMGLSAGEYSDELVVGIQEDSEKTATVTASVKVAASETPEKTVSVKATPGSMDFGSLQEGYSKSPAAKTVTVTNNGTEPVSLAQPESKSYTIGELSGDYLEAGETADFTVAPKKGLNAGEYNGNINVRDTDGNILAKVAVTFMVTTPDPVYNLVADPDSLDFGSRETGYENIPDAQTVTVTNAGNMTAVLEQPSADAFAVGELSAQTLEPGEVATFTVQPKAGLSKGEYLEDIAIGNDGDMEIYATAYFSVSESVNKFTGSKKPSDITGLANGTAKTAEALQLPSAVTITTTKGDASAAVEWDVKGCSYNPASSDKQAFSVKGNITLPDGVQNPDKISTVTSVNVVVEAHKALEANPAQNMITGISSDGKYTTDTKITFTAIGAGMDNSKPGKGDTRYLPLSWKITETRAWEEAPYTATFRVSKAGNYTLTVTFGQQRYDGTNWKSTGVQSNSQVSFTVLQAASVTATPSASKKPAVLTGDNTPVMTFVIILVLAAVCVGGVLVYKKKKK